MNEEIKTTRKSIVLAFKIWNKRSLKNPKEFKEISYPKECAERQANYLIELLEKF